MIENKMRFIVGLYDKISFFLKIMTDADTNPTMYSSKATMLFKMAGQYCILPLMVSLSAVELI
jgi:hypothetical protein